MGSFAWLSLYVVVATAGVWLFYRRMARYDTATAYFSAAPGGLNEMILAGGALGGDERRISMSHAARILIAIFVLSFGYRWFGDYAPVGAAATHADNIAMERLADADRLRRRRISSSRAPCASPPTRWSGRWC